MADGQLASPLAARAVLNASGLQGHIRRQSLPVSEAPAASKSSLAFTGDPLTILQKNHRERELDNSFMGTRLSKGSMTNPHHKKKASMLDYSSPGMKKEEEVPRSHLMRIDETASNLGHTSLFFTNETFMFKPGQLDGAGPRSKVKAKSILDVRAGQRDPTGPSSPMGQNPASQAYSTPKAELKALKGVRRFKRESMLGRNAIHSQFSSTVRDQGEASEASRKVYLPDIIRLSKTNLHDIAKLTGQKEADFLRRFKNSIQLAVHDEDRFEQKVAQGKIPPPKHPARLDSSTCTYQNAQDIHQIEPTNIKKKRYHKAFGESWQLPDPKQEVHYLQRCQEEFNKV